MNAVIRLNNKKLIKELENLGYTIWSVDEEDIGLVAGEFNFKAQSYSLPDKIELCVVGLLDLEDFGDFVSHGYIDCGENEDLFLAVAALRGDSDYRQWFIDDDGDWFYFSEIKMLDNSVRKATLPELIEYFKK